MTMIQVEDMGVVKEEGGGIMMKEAEERDDSYRRCQCPS